MANYPLGQIDQYGLLEELGSGSFGTVYLCEHSMMKSKYALKALNASLVHNPKEVDSFTQEIQTIAELKHPRIVGIVYAGINNNPAGIHHGAPFYVMEAAETNLEQYAVGKSFPQDEFVAYMTQIATGLQYAHSRGIVHRDVKEANILIKKRLIGELMLTDFGIAVTSQSVRSERLDASGTFAYMAKEMILGKARSASDQYSLAVLAYHLLSGGKDPYGIEKGSASTGAYLYHHTQGTPVPFAQQGITTVPPAVELAIFRALSNEYQLRFPTIMDFASAIKVAYAGNIPTLGNIGLPSTVLVKQERPIQPQVMQMVSPMACPTCKVADRVVKASVGVTGGSGYQATLNSVIRERLKAPLEPTYKSPWGIGSVITMIFLCSLAAFFLLALMGSMGDPSLSSYAGGYFIFFFGFLIACITLGYIKHKSKAERMQQLASSRIAWSQEMQDYDRTYFCQRCENKFLVAK